ncbi:MAG: hypothetical protein M3530_06050 [Thermoproteota archaeon]|nr:hypothetical protein [Thermoproteota archaeon]
MDASKVILAFGLMIIALGVASSGIVQSVQGDYGLAANKLKQKAQEIQNKPNIPDSIENEISSALNGHADRILSKCANAPPSYPCN